MTEDTRVRSIIVVGGGTAGWLSATYLQRALGESVHVTLVESATIPKIGVGEATVATLRFTMQFLGFSEEAWMPEVGATYKTAVRFEQWNQPPSQGEEHFYHPFFERNEPLVHPLPSYFPEHGEGVSLMHYWLKRKLEGDTTPYAHAVFPGPAICDHRKAPRFKGAPAHEVPSAYHLDAHKFAAFLKKHATQRGVVHVVDDIDEVLQDERGHIQGVRTREHGVLSADLFVDCSGFRSILLGKALKEPFQSAAKYLWCDSAIAVPAANAPGDLEPYTNARASQAGWMWNIPLVHRAGTGYVYSSRYASKEAAEQELRSYLGSRINANTEVNHLKFTPGRYERTFVNNCVAVGLSSSFIEPLESTTIFLIEYSLAQLLTFFPDRSFSPMLASRYNRAVASMYQEVRDFIILHFIYARRRDTAFWRDLGETCEVPDTLAEQLAFYKHSFPVDERFRNFVFRERSYACLLSGLGQLPSAVNPLIQHFSDDAARRAFEAIHARTADLVARLPGHREYLEDMYKRAGFTFG